MLFHVVLFRPRPDLSAEDRAALVETLNQALRQISSIRRFSVGRRIRHGAAYEGLMPVDLEYAALLEFDDLAALRAYLQHPAHEPLGRRFMASLESSAIYDYEIDSAETLARE